jgi:hypothetical protein
MLIRIPYDNHGFTQLEIITEPQYELIKNSLPRVIQDIDDSQKKNINENYNLRKLAFPIFVNVLLVTLTMISFAVAFAGGIIFMLIFFLTLSMLSPLLSRIKLVEEFNKKKFFYRQMNSLASGSTTYEDFQTNFLKWRRIRT